MAEWLIIALRTIGLFSLLILLAPLIGKKPISSMTFFDITAGLVTAVLIALISLKVIGNLAYGLIALFLWVISIIAIQFLTQKFKTIHDYIYGKEIVVIKEGKVLEENLQTARLTAEELLSQLRRKDIFQVADVEFAVMEGNGEITALLKREKQTLTPQDLRIKVSSTQEPQTVILDGTILDEPLTTLGLNREWLLDELNKTGVALENVFIGQIDSMGELYVDLFNDSLMVPPPATKEILLINLKSAEADLLKFSLETEDKNWKSLFAQHAQELRKIKERLEPHLTT